MKWLKILAGAAAGLYALYYFAFPTYTHKFRLTFQVEVDGKVKEGSSVITVYDKDLQWMPLVQKRWRRWARGPSPWIDLGERGIILVSMTPHGRYEPRPFSVAALSFAAYFDARPESNKIELEYIKKISSEHGIRQLMKGQLPSFIWFPSPMKPSSAKVVAPKQFPEIVGPDVKLGLVTVEITNAEPNRSLYDKLPWLAELERQQVEHGMKWSEEFVLNASDLVGDL